LSLLPLSLLALPFQFPLLLPQILPGFAQVLSLLTPLAGSIGLAHFPALFPDILASFLNFLTLFPDIPAELRRRRLRETQNGAHAQ
jgi:hypothetical protein